MIEGGLRWECWWPRSSGDSAREREPASNHLEQHDAKSVKVGTDVNGPGIAELLGGHVGPGTQPRRCGSSEGRRSLMAKRTRFSLWRQWLKNSADVSAERFCWDAAGFEEAMSLRLGGPVDPTLTVAFWRRTTERASGGLTTAPYRVWVAGPRASRL